MESLESELARARGLDVGELADAIETIGFECTRCGACCKASETEDRDGDPHTATVFPDEIRALQGADDGEYDFRDVARPMPYGLTDGEDGPEGETFEWALQTDACGDCRFYSEDETEAGACTVHEDRPLICRTYPFSVALGGTSQPMGKPIDEVGMVRAHECEGLGHDIDRAEAMNLAAALKERAIRELEEAIGVRDRYEPTDPPSGEIIVHDSEGQKHPDGTLLDSEHELIPDSPFDPRN